MNGRDRGFVDRLDRVLAEMACMSPSNPANGRAISENLHLTVRASTELHAAIGALRGSDWEAVDAHLSEAERITSRVGVT